ncbi:MAG: hypothetical protein IT312_09200 [Anaerolineales bacterium]|nr:hypothetical protein [Anaerolineales bacterium]
MATFDQRNQKVGYQFNANEINFSSVQSNESLLIELKKLRTEFARAGEMGVFEKNVAEDVSGKLEKALNEAEKPKPNKLRVEEYLNEVKTLVEGITAVAGLVTALSQAIGLVRGLL